MIKPEGIGYLSGRGVLAFPVFTCGCAADWGKRNMQDVMELFFGPTRDWFGQTFGEPTQVQGEAWREIAAGKPVLVSAPTGTGKTLSAFLIFIDQLMQQAARGQLKEGLQLVYISPLKSLAADIRENLRRPLDGIRAFLQGDKAEISVAIRTGDTTQKERQHMAKHPPHILITTPESLFLLLTSVSGKKMLKTARAVVIDEMHALIDTKRGAHLLFSVARLEQLCGGSLQRIGLSATIQPLELAAQWLSPKKAAIVAPPMPKRVEITVVGTTPAKGRRRDPVWEEVAQKVYERCMGKRSVIAFSEGRRYAEKLAYYVNQIAGEEFARVHHGSLSKEQRDSVEQALREGRLRLLCATSSMELGIDVGEIDEVIQVGCPRTVSSAMQRLGRAGHNPGRVSFMQMYPRTASEGLYCGMTAALAMQGSVEEARPPRLCLDVLAQHLVSMAAGAAKDTQEGSISYSVEDVLALTCRAWPFAGVTRETVTALLRMLAGDYEHNREVPVRPRILYDRIHQVVYPDPYSRMLAVAAGGTIPDKGLYAAKTLDGVKLGELDEEFVYESYIGDRFLLGAFGWRIVAQDKDTVYVEPAAADSARVPFWKGEIKGRSLKTGLAFGSILGSLGRAQDKTERLALLQKMGLDEAAAENAADFLGRQIAATGCLPDDKTLVVEHFCDHTGSHQIMIHSVFGRRINAPLAIVLQDALRETYHMNAGCVDEEDGILLYPYGEEKLPEGILRAVDIQKVRAVLEIYMPQTPLFSMTFRYNAARALMMGMKRNGRQPLWMQRLRSTEMLDSLVQEKGHPLMVETSRECMEDLWDVEGLLWLLSGIRSGLVGVREVYVETPSPMSLPLQWQVEAAEMYAYTPVTPGIQKEAFAQRNLLEGIRPSQRELEQGRTGRRLPENPAQLHTLLMTEGDLEARELDGIQQEMPEGGQQGDAPFGGWLERLARDGMAVYLEPGLWVAAEHQEEYGEALAWMSGEGTQKIPESALHILRRMLFYRGAADRERICGRYVARPGRVEALLQKLVETGEAVEDEGVFYHARLYGKAQKATLLQLRREVVTQPGAHYAAMMAQRSQIHASPQDQLRETVALYCGQAFAPSFWEEILFPARVKSYRGSMLDSFLAQGDYFWRFLPDGKLCFEKTEEVDWEAETAQEHALDLQGDQKILCEQLKKRGASFLKQLSHSLENGDAQAALLELAQKGLVYADSFVPVRQALNRDRIAKATARQRVNAKVQAMSAGRWDLVRPCRGKTMEQWLEILFTQNLVLCRETFRKPEADSLSGEVVGMSWGDALRVLRVWEYVGKVRRGYFVAGMSGAQFIRQEDYPAVTAALETLPEETCWLHATDPACVWGKALPLLDGTDFLAIPSTAVALRRGNVTAVAEKKGKTLRILEPEYQEEAILGLAEAFRGRRVFVGQKRMVVNQFPPEAAPFLKAAGFLREMQDYVLYV